MNLVIPVKAGIKIVIKVKSFYSNQDIGHSPVFVGRQVARRQFLIKFQIAYCIGVFKSPFYKPCKNLLHIELTDDLYGAFRGGGNA